MRVHHVNCGTMCPVSPLLVNGGGSLFGRARMVCHCLIVETRNSGLAIVDTGLGTADIANPFTRLGRGFMLMAPPTLDPAETALARVEQLGHRRENVRHLLPTHLDVDHAGGLPDFPDATVHVLASEHEAALARATLSDRERYRAAHFAHDPTWNVHRVDGERWFGFEAVRAVPGTEDEILLVPLVGHSLGHCGVAVRTDDGWLLHCGDAYFHHEEMHPSEPYCTPFLSLFQLIVGTDHGLRRQNQQRLRDLARAHGDEVKVFCAHSPVELARLGGA
jgi:glyoxylase-like metal-dependent hydrolase (beta-lactamase superfamily II)